MIFTYCMHAEGNASIYYERAGTKETALTVLLPLSKALGETT